MSSQKNDKHKEKAFTNRELSLFCSQLALVIRSGISLHDGLESMNEDSGGGEHWRRVLSSLSESIGEGEPLYKAFQETGVFPEYMVHMIEIGERAGKLEEVMTSLSGFYDREDKIKQEIRGAVIYPGLLVCMMAAVILVLVVRVLPVFQKVFENLGVQMSSTAQALMNFGIIASQYSMVIAGLLAALIIGLLVYARVRGDAGYTATLPGMKKITEKISAGRFASALSLMLSSGYDTRAALDLIPNILTGKEIKKKVERVKFLVDGGVTLSDAVKQAGIFPGLYSKMVAVGFKTGAIDEVMKELSDLYQEEIDTSLNNFVAVLEPALVAALSIVIGVIILSVMLPLMGIMSSIG